MSGHKLDFWSTTVKAEFDKKPCYKSMWHFAGVELQDDETLHHVFVDYRETNLVVFGSATIGDDDEAARMIALREQIATLDGKILGDVFGESARTLIKEGEANFKCLCLAYGGVEGLLRNTEKAFVIKVPKESPYPVGHKVNPEQVVRDLVRFEMAGERSAGSVSEGVFVKMW